MDAVRATLFSRMLRRARFTDRRTQVSMCVTALLLAVFALLTWPVISPGILTGDIKPDSYDYAYGALALLHGRYLVDWSGTLQVPRYPPGFSILLAPAVALGGVESAVWMSFGAALLLGLLAAALAWRLGGPTAAPVAIALTLFVPGVTYLAQVVMSDLPSAALVLLELALLALGRRVTSTVIAGILAGGLVWIRLAAAPLLFAGLLGLTARPSWRRNATCYIVGAVIPLAGLGAWQLATFGSPVITSYQAAGAGAGGQHTFGSFFSSTYLLGQPEWRDSELLGGEARIWRLPNLAMYPLQLAGADGFLSLPGVGLLGFAGLARYAKQSGPTGVIGRFALLAVLLMLVTYLPYFYQSARFLLPASVLLAVAAAALLTHITARILWRLSRSRL